MPIVRTPDPISQPLNLIPAVDFSTGLVVWVPEQTYRLHQSRGGRLDLSLVLEPSGEAQASTQAASAGSTAAVDDTVRYSRPRSLSEWATAFGMSSDTMGRWFRTGQVRAVRRGRFWCVDVRDLPRAVKD